MIWWIVAIAAFLILRSVLRAFSARPGAPGYGPGYGYGGYGGGGSFWSGLLGGLGGAWLGNELVHGAGGAAPTQAGELPPDTAGQADAGQADAGGGGFGGGGGESGGGW